MSDALYNTFFDEFYQFTLKLDAFKPTISNLNIDLSTPILKIEEYLYDRSQLAFILETSRSSVIPEKEKAFPSQRDGVKPQYSSKAGTEHWSVQHDNFLLKTVYCYSSNWKKIRTRISKKYETKFEVSFLKEKYEKIKNNKNDKKGRFSDSEDKLLFQLVDEHGTNWMKISNYFTMRSPLMIKNRYYYLKKFQIS